MSLFHLVTTPTTFQMIQWTSYTDGAFFAVSREVFNLSSSNSQSDSSSCYHAQPEQFNLPTGAVAIQNSFTGLALKGKTWPKPYCRIQAFSVDQGALRKPARGSSSSSPYVIYVQWWLAKTRRKISWQVRLYQKSQIGKGRSILCSHFQSSSKAKQ